MIDRPRSTVTPVNPDFIQRKPPHWGLAPLFAVARPRNTKNVGMREDNLLSLSFGRIVRRDINTNEGLLPESFETYQIVEPGDTVFRLTDLQNDQRSLRTALVQERGIITSAYLALEPTGVQPEYFSYLVRAYDHDKTFYRMGSGLRQSLKFEELRRLPVLVPPYEEQRRIAAFLNHETARIDELVREQERLQVLLEEKRNEVIGRAVREGLDGQEPIEIDDVFIRRAPTGWMVSPLRRFLKYISPLPVGEAWRDYTLLSLTKQGIVERDIDSGFGKFPAEFNGYQRVEPGQVVFCLFDMDETPRTVGYSEKRGMITSAYAVFEPTEYGNGEFVSYYFQYVDSYKGLRPFYSGLRKTIRPSNFLGIRVAMPDLSEQERIVRFLDAELEKLDSLADAAQSSTDLLLERRSALISAAVTGQLDLRYWQAPEPEAAAEVA